MFQALLVVLTGGIVHSKHYLIETVGFDDVVNQDRDYSMRGFLKIMGKPDYIDLAVESFRKLLIDEDLEHFLNTGEEKVENIGDTNDNGEEDDENDDDDEEDDENNNDNNGEEDKEINNNGEVGNEKDQIKEQLELLKLRK
ncbi:rRNA-processing protein EFG1 [Eurytemora carolleeae]|uniref:rRNA-processing protein EFG1 n=1 Tax=Eurytemora carolleeae TaxID=1294199 RepID=UPI000C780B9D|nr:rRNA-processing protein EFG1 [Eurytemora carolleeae]|eukprot:XP_023321420.1 rRNA-processing protein EFG1-like [Eurytemora affinis]